MDMKTKSLIIITISIIIAIFCVGAMVWYFSQKIQQTETPDNANCGVETCHGLNIVCGTNPATACTSIYMIGDKCLQYAQCGVQNNTCQQIQNPKFTECKSCVQECIDTNSDDNEKLFDCESRCI